MILVSGAPIDNTVIEQYPRNSVEAEVLRQMRESSAQYRYDSLEQLDFELRMRREIVNAARELSRSGMDFAVFQKSRRNPQYWDRTDNGGFRLKEGAVPSQAIRDIFENGREYATECATAMVIVYYKALLNLFGEDAFNTLFPRIYLMNWHQIDPRLQGIGSPRRVDDMLIGDRGYIANPDVDPKTPEWQGENVIVMPGGVYYGHGMGITSAERIIRALNSRRKRDATRSAYLMDSAARPDFNRLAGLYQGAVSHAYVLRAFPPAYGW